MAPSSVFVDFFEEVRGVARPPLEPELAGEGGGGRLHAGELLLGHLAVVVDIGLGKSPEENVVELDVGVVDSVLDRALHEEDKLILVANIHDGDQLF